MSLEIQPATSSISSRVLEHKADIDKVQEWLCHESISTTRVYDERARGLRIHPRIRSPTAERLTWLDRLNLAWPGLAWLGLGCWGYQYVSPVWLLRSGSCRSNLMHEMQVSAISGYPCLKKDQSPTAGSKLQQTWLGVYIWRCNL